MSLNISCCEWFCMSVTDVNINFCWTWWYGEGAAQWVLHCKGKQRQTHFLGCGSDHACSWFVTSRNNGHCRRVWESGKSNTRQESDNVRLQTDGSMADSSTIKQFSCQRTSYHHRQFFNYRERERVTGNRLWWLVMMRLIDIIIDGRWLLVEDRK